MAGFQQLLHFDNSLRNSLGRLYGQQLLCRTRCHIYDTQFPTWLIPDQSLNSINSFLVWLTRYDLDQKLFIFSDCDGIGSKTTKEIWCKRRTRVNVDVVTLSFELRYETFQHL